MLVVWVPYVVDCVSGFDVVFGSFAYMLDHHIICVRVSGRWVESKLISGGVYAVYE